MSNSTFKINQSPQKKPRLRWPFVAALFIIVGLAVGAYAYTQKQDEQKQADQKAKDEAQVESAKTENMETASKNESGTNSPSSPPSGSVSSDSSVSITQLSQTNGSVAATATVIGASGAGACVFTFSTADAQPVVRTANSSASESGQACSISAPEVEFSKIGQWNLTVTFTIGSNKLEASKSVTIN